MSEPDSTRPADARAFAKCSLFHRLDGKLSAAGYALPAPAAAPPPLPALSFEDWAELSVRLIDASPEALVAALSARGLTVPVWKHLEAEYLLALRTDARAGRGERPALYEALNKEEMARRAALAGTPSAPTPERVPAALSGTALAPDLGAATWEATGRMPFVPPPPAPPLKGKPPAKTVPSKAVPDRVGSGTMALDPAQQRPTPTLPFEGSKGSTGVGHVPRLSAEQYVALCARIVLVEAKDRVAMLGGYGVPNEAAFRAVEEHWRHPARRAELEEALAAFAAAVRGRAIG